jgi:hypothetical protein
MGISEKRKTHVQTTNLEHPATPCASGVQCQIIPTETIPTTRRDARNSGQTSALGRSRRVSALIGYGFPEADADG